MGAILFQLPPSFTVSEFKNTEQFLDRLPTATDYYYAMEFRHPSWETEGPWEMLKHYSSCNDLEAGCGITILDRNQSEEERRENRYFHYQILVVSIPSASISPSKSPITLFRNVNLPFVDVPKKCAPRHFAPPEELILPRP